MNNMAKLNVVIPAVEVTVEVEGRAVAYRKVDRKAQAGDIIRFDDAHLPRYVRNESFYAVCYIGSGGNPYIADEDGDSYYTGGDDFEVYAPISEPATQPTTDTITFEGATWRKVDRDVREGDAIKFTDEGRRSYLTDAGLYVVDHVDSCDDPQITDDDGDDYDAGSDDYEVYEKVADSAAQEYREVKRKANVGDRIKITNRVKREDRYEDDAEFIVKRADSDGDVYVDTETQESVMVLRSEYAVLEPVTKSAETPEPAKKAEPERLAVGDYARVVDGEKINSGARVGDIVEILVDDKSYVPYKVRTISGYRVGEESWALPSAFVRATDEEVAKVLAAKDPRSKFAAGDKVRLVSGGTKWPLAGFEDGGIYTVGSPTNSYHKGTRVEIMNGSHGGFALPPEIVKLTAAEIAEIERKQAEEDAKRAEEARWTAIGRKVNEYKVGDIVEIIDSLGGSNKKGEIGMVVDARRHGENPRVGTVTNPSGVAGRNVVKLIVPVEQRFDRAEEVDAA